MQEKIEKKKLLVTGSEGFLATRIIKFYSDNYHVIGLNHKEMDFTDESHVADCFERYQPDMVIHCGAISDIGACAENPEYSYKVNVEGTKFIAKACAQNGAKLIFCSSDQVYFESSEKNAHKEIEQVKPPHVYGKQKLEAEELCMKYNKDTIILRLSWMYDWKKMRSTEHGNLITAIEDALRDRVTLSYPIYDFRSITNVWEVVKNLDKTFHISPGIYNFGSPNQQNTYEVVKSVLEHMGVDSNLVQKNTESFKNNPRNLVMDQEKLNNAGIYFVDTIHGISM